MYFYVFGSFDVFTHVLQCFYESVINMFFMFFFYLQINVFNIYDVNDCVVYRSPYEPLQA